MRRLPLFVIMLCLAIALSAASGCGKKAETPPETPPASGTQETATADETPTAVPEGEMVTYAIDPDYSAVMWNATVAKLGTREGGWTLFEGTVSMVEGHPETMKIDVTVDMTSAYADDPQITKKLQGEEHFFKPATYPTSTFKSKGVKKTADGYSVTGDFTIRGITKELTFPATVTVEGDKLTAQAEVDMIRQDFEITYNSALGDYVINDVCQLIMDIVANKTDAPAA